ncbi:hypothetical protein KSC_010300 [Ktedonobacter sp. SOSP1-52]|nr:hypothetical protein KSC_010300 [Ktedonobacter sp. SOSP1-52]
MHSIGSIARRTASTGQDAQQDKATYGRDNHKFTQHGGYSFNLSFCHTAYPRYQFYGWSHQVAITLQG